MKKTSYILGAIALFASASMASAQTITHDFQFNDAATTGLQSVANTGTVSTDTWNFDVKDGALIQGAGNGSAFVIGADATAVTTTITKDYTRKVEFGTAITTGTYSLDIKMASWTLTNGAISEGFTFKLGNDGVTGQINQVFAVNADASNVRSRHSVAGVVGGAAAQTNVGFTGTDFFWRVAGDLDAGTFTTSYSTDGITYNALIANGTGFTSIGEFLLGIEGTTTWNSASQTAIDSITLTVVPEPSTYALLGGLCALSFAAMRRRRG